MSNEENFPKAADADIALLLESTFPYISGGVSSWVNQIIQAFPEIRFAVVFLGSRRKDYGNLKYALPDNVVHVETHYLYDDLSSHGVDVVSRPGDAAVFSRVGDLHDAFRRQGAVDLSAFDEVTARMMHGRNLTLKDFLHSEQSWAFITDSYRRFCTDPSFVDYFWTVRIMHQPLWKLTDIAKNMIPVRALHAVSTGYAGLLGALLARSRGLPLILSEHGIYTKERKIDLYQSEWIRDNRNPFQKDSSELSHFQTMWIHFFEWLGRICYDSADPIIALYEKNRLRQIEDGASEERTCNIPNGVNVGRLAALRERRGEKIPPVLCLIGRVVPIKDVKTFIRAMLILANRMPVVEGWIAGPVDEDPAYARECREFAENLGLGDRLQFLGFQQIEDLMPKIGVVVLTSISEALPLVILEGFAAGVPALTTDVGACRQLVYGLDEEDRALGAGGRVVGIANPEELADAAISLLKPDNWYAAQAAGIARVEKYYSDELMFDRYRAVYMRALNHACVPGADFAPMRCPFGG
ncbi:GT4 family glycosyltransferase PelF [Uliginosibacterium flavum]|uniref:GT4 family glycosyltransferase PelF n=1 Tax=Uliginosibacterium flavum TaxID=1396831 RepID=A0ABV2TG64_9RHOO